MNNKTFITTDDVAEILGVSKSYAYKIVRKLNAELAAKGYLTVAGRVNRKYFMEKACYGENILDGRSE
ncbi:MAG: helix-turn-helix domain-containing protein [Firmicutes bacterium]|nr:helix-turn-helix domain-containing protein [Bacillota bacterium]